MQVSKECFALAAGAVKSSSFHSLLRPLQQTAWSLALGECIPIALPQQCRETVDFGGHHVNGGFIYIYLGQGLVCRDHRTSF